MAKVAEWKLRLPIEQILRDFQVSEGKSRRGAGGTRWIDTNCPLNTHEGQDEHPSFSILAEGGGWTCHTCDRKGDIVELYAELGGYTPGMAKAMLTKTYIPKSDSEQKTSDTRAASIEMWAKDLWSDDPTPGALAARQYIEDHATSRELAEEIKLGWNGEEIVVPFFFKDGEIAGAKTIQILDGGAPISEGAKRKRRHLWKCDTPYGLQRFEPEGKTIFICEGEPDWWALQSLGANAITLGTGAGKQFTWGRLAPFMGEAASEASTFFLLLDNDSAGTKTKLRLAKEMGDVGVANVVDLPVPPGHKDIAEYLERVAPEARTMAFQAHCQEHKADKLTFSDEANGVLAKGNELISEDGKVLAEFIGHVTVYGHIRDAGGIQDACIWTIELQHKNGQKLTVDIGGDARNFAKEIEEAPDAGPGWAMDRRHQEIVRTYILNNQKSTQARRVDRGWIFGFAEGDTEKFYSPDWTFTNTGVQPNKALEYDPQSQWLERFSLPFPDRPEVKEAAKLVFSHLLKIHRPTVMMPLLITALLAPIRRLVIPEEHRWWTMVIGSSGNSKTSRCLLIQALFGSQFTHTSTLLDTSSTPLAMEHIMSLLGDAVAYIDELKQSALPEAAWTEMLRMIQSVTAGSGRHRMGRLGQTLHEGVAAQCLPMTSSESVPVSDEAMMGRSLFIPTGTTLFNWMDVQDLTQHLANNLDLMAPLLSGWIERWMREVTPTSTWKTEFDLQTYALRPVLGEIHSDWAISGNGTRVFQRMVIYSTAFELFLKWAEEIDAIDTIDAKEWRDTWRKVACQLFDFNMVNLNVNNIQSVTVEAITGAITSRACKMHFFGTGTPDWFRDHLEVVTDTRAPLIGMLHVDPRNPRPEALFKYQGKKVCLYLLPTVANLVGERTWKAARRTLVESGVLLDAATMRKRWMNDPNPVEKLKVKHSYSYVTAKAGAQIMQAWELLREQRF